MSKIDWPVIFFSLNVLEVLVSRLCWPQKAVWRLLFSERIGVTLGFPGGAVVKNPPANAGDTGSSPGPGRTHMPRSN